MRSILGRTVKELGFEIIEAANGREALAQLAAHGPVELGMVDWNMPEMTGIEFLSALRKMRDYDGCKVIMVTTSAEASHISLALASGASEYLMKPFTKDMLLAKLRMMGVEVP